MCKGQVILHNVLTYILYDDYILGLDGQLGGPDYCYPVSLHVTRLSLTYSMARWTVNRLETGNFNAN